MENGDIYLIFFLFKHTDIGLEKLHYVERELLDAKKSKMLNVRNARTLTCGRAFH